jgi:ABC-type multidrug transport system ATPase subunit
MLEIAGLTKTYPNGVRALEGVTLSLDNGVFGLLGPNGAGKSSLMRTLATLQAPDAGTVRLDGADVLADPQSLRARLGYLPQDFGVYPRVTAEALLEHVAVLKGLVDRPARRAQVDALLRLTNLHAVRKKDVSTFSGGMRQRFGIAQALLGTPRLLVVDEPTAGLDPEERNRFHDLLSELGERCIVLLSTHIVEDVRDLCPTMAVLAKGRVVEEGVPGELVAALAGQVWQRTVPRAELDAVRSSLPVLSTHLLAGQTQVRVRSASQPGPGFEPVAPELEDVYFAALQTC